MTKKNIIIIGAGVSGIFCGKRLSESGHSILLIDKGRAIGGRLSTRKTDGAVFHHGASSLPDFYKHKELPEFALATFKRAEKEKIIHRIDNSFAPVSSVSHLVTYLAKNLKTKEGCQATSLDLNRRTVEVKCGDSCNTIPYDLLILSIPPIQAINLINNQIDEFERHLEKAQMRSSASALFSFDLNPSLIRDKQFSNQRVVVEVENNRFQCQQKLLCLTVHTKENFAKKVVNNDKNKIRDILFEELSSVVPISLPAPIYEAGHRWLYGFTATSLDKSHLYYEKKNLGICGDWCLGDTILHAASSGIKLAEQILAS